MKKLAAAVHGIFNQPDQETGVGRLSIGARAIQRDVRQSHARSLEDGLGDALTFMAFPSAHWSRISSTNQIERINREIRRRHEGYRRFPERGVGAASHRHDFA